MSDWESSDKWELIGCHDSCFTIFNMHKANFDSPAQLQALGRFKSMLYYAVQHDYITNDSTQVAYKITYKLEKLPGGFFKECEHESDGCCYIDELSLCKCKICGEFYR